MKKTLKNNIPEELKSLDQWVGWVEKENEVGKMSKIPINPNKRETEYADVSDPKTWGSFKKAIKACDRIGLNGIGFVFTEMDPYVGIDLDDCYEPNTETFDITAIVIVRDLDSYTEFSPSGEGLHIIAKAILNFGNRKGKYVEIYDRVRFFTVTGNHLKISPTEIHDRDDEIQDLIETHFPSKKTDYSEPSILTSTDLSDDEIISRAKKAKNGDKFWRLWNGDIREYSSASEADLALCKILGFWVGHDSNRIDRLFRKSKLFRKKWNVQHRSDGKTYGQITIEKTIEANDEVHDPRHEHDSLTQIALQAELFHSRLKQPYATVPVDDHFETWSIESKEFKSWLRHQHYKTELKSPKQANLQEVLDRLNDQATFESPEYQLYTRVAEQNGEIFLDLANAKRDVVRINGDGWTITNNSPVKFRRSKGMSPLPRPRQNGKIGKLRSILNITDADRWTLLVSWLVGALSATGPYPILLLLGPQGSLKSTHGRILRALVDPSAALLRTLPTSDRNLMITANNSWVLAYDNLSNLKQWLSDAFCKLSTGGGFAIRKNYADEEEMIFDSKRPIILNGINVLAYNHDLVDRCIIINLPQIKKKDRRPEAEIMKNFEKVQPSILGGLCSAISTAIKNHPNISLTSYPRMADFAKWVTAAEPALPWGEGDFMKCYNLNRAEAIERSLETDPVAEAVIEMMKHLKKWSGTATDLRETLEGDPGKENGYVSLNVIQSKSWPKVPHVLSGRLKRASTFLFEIGIEVIFQPRESNKRGITIRRIK